MQGHVKAGILLVALGLYLSTSPACARPAGLARQLQQNTTGQFNGPSTIPVYISAGDVTTKTAVLWARCPEAAQVTFSLARACDNSRKFANKYRAVARAGSDYTVKVVVDGLKSNTKYTYKAVCKLACNNRGISSPQGTFRTTPKKNEESEVTFAWVADIAGQGWGVNLKRPFKLSQGKPFNGDVLPGGYYFAETVARLDPDFVVWAGDTIYADGPIKPSQAINVTKANGSVIVEQGVWTNDYWKDFQAVTLPEFRNVWLYNYFDSYFAKLMRSSAHWVEWDDHEVTNNWYPGELNARPGLNADVLVPPATQSFYEYTPITPGSTIYRSHQHGKHLEVINVDLRSYKGSNVDVTIQPVLSQIYGETQFNWLKATLKDSKATWKVIVNDLPLGYAVGDGAPNSWESFSQKQNALLGRELQVRELLSFIKQEGIKGVVLITADVHMTGVIEYSPDRAQGGFKEFSTFYEFVIGPCHAGSFGAPDFDMSFGPQHVFVRTPATEGYDQNNLPPPYTSSFGYGHVSKKGDLTLQTRDIDGRVLYSKTFKA